MLLDNQRAHQESRNDRPPKFRNMERDHLHKRPSTVWKTKPEVQSKWGPLHVPFHQVQPIINNTDNMGSQPSTIKGIKAIKSTSFAKDSYDVREKIYLAIFLSPRNTGIQPCKTPPDYLIRQRKGNSGTEWLEWWTFQGLEQRNYLSGLANLRSKNLAKDQPAPERMSWQRVHPTWLSLRGLREQKTDKTVNAIT